MERLLRAKNEEEKVQSVCARNIELEVFQRKQRWQMLDKYFCCYLLSAIGNSYKITSNTAMWL